MKGLLEILLQKRYGEPKVIASTPLIAYRWNEGAEKLICTIYKYPDRRQPRNSRSCSLELLYGDALGGSLLCGALKVSMLDEPKVFGLYRIEELQERPEVRHANSIDPGIGFFMDSANVWFYGAKNDQLFVYDCETEELDFLGSLEQELETLLDQWEHVKRKSQGKDGESWGEFRGEEREEKGTG